MLFQVALMILKFLEAPMLSCRDEAEAIKILNDFLANIGKKQTQENKVQDEDETVKVRGSWRQAALHHVMTLWQTAFTSLCPGSLLCVHSTCTCTVCTDMYMYCRFTE